MNLKTAAPVVTTTLTAAIPPPTTTGYTESVPVERLNVELLSAGVRLNVVVSPPDCDVSAVYVELPVRCRQSVSTL